jgi:hypothetical protein
MKSPLKFILLALITIMVIIQFLGVDRTLPLSPPTDDVFSVLDAREEIEMLLKSACYDCHSNQTQYPWYSYIAPVSWMIQDHVLEGRKQINFSTWATYPEQKAIEKLEDCFEVLAKEQMPLESYQWLHSEAQLTEAERVRLISWFRKSKLGLTNSNN